ncbi:MAG: pilus assembly protein TadG-related protein [Vampirovibrionia bacterium]
MTYCRDKKGVSLVLLAFGLVTLLGFAALAIDMGNAFNVQNELQKATTTAALSGASVFNLKDSSSDNINNIQQAVTGTFDLYKASEPGLASATVVGNVQVDTKSGAVRLQTKADAQTFFIGIIGIKNLEVNARAAALNHPVPYIVMNDLFPLPKADQKKTVAFPESENPMAGSAHYYHSYPGGRVQLVCTLPLVNSQGPEISVIETGDLDGYSVLVSSGPAGPWYNITSTGVAYNGGPGPQPKDPPGSSALDQRFFGSGSFDLQGTGIENARYIAILDDNLEDGYQAFDKATYVPDGTFTSVSTDEGGSAMEIDAVLIHQHAISIPFDDLSTDDDGDGVMDAYNKLLGTYDAPGQLLTDPTDP